MNHYDMKKIGPTHKTKTDTMYSAHLRDINNHFYEKINTIN